MLSAMLPLLQLPGALALSKKSLTDAPEQSFRNYEQPESILLTHWNLPDLGHMGDWVDMVLDPVSPKYLTLIVLY